MQGQKQTREFDREVAALAERQHGVVGRKQLREIGISDTAIDGRVAVGRLHRLHRGVFAVGHRAIGVQGRRMAAVLASGPGAVLSHASAAALWGLRGATGGPVHVTTARKCRSSDSIRRHFSLLPEDETTTVDGISVTTVPRTIFDLAATGTTDRVESLVRESEYRQLYDRLSLPDLLERYPRRRGAPRIRVALERIEGLPPGRPKSPLEERFLPFLLRYGLPRPHLNEWIVLDDKRYQVDCHWHGTSQIVELDGWEGHGTRSAFRSDRARDRRLRVAGYSVTRVSWAQLEDEPEAVAADLRHLLSHYKRT